jgi:hypothetical protein
MVYGQTPLQHHFFQIAVTERIAQVPADAQQSGCPIESDAMGTGEATIRFDEYSQLLKSLVGQHPIELQEAMAVFTKVLNSGPKTLFVK